MYGRWGSEHKHDFWTALANGEVDTAELRAMELLESVCDSYRFHLYCITGEMPAVGNVTGTVFMLAKSGGVVELEDGRVVKYWCISIGPHIRVPGTDNVVVLKAMIEGEEMEFRRIGNDNTFSGYGRHRPIGVADPYEASWIPDNMRQTAQALQVPGDFTDLFSVPSLMQTEAKMMRSPIFRAEEAAQKKREEAYSDAESWVNQERSPKGSGTYTTDTGNAILGHGYLPHPRRMEYEGNVRDLLEVRNELTEGPYLGEDGGVRLADGEPIFWDSGQARQAEERFGLQIREQVILMNGEGRDRDQIKWFLRNYFQVEPRDHGTPNIQFGNAQGPNPYVWAG